MWGLIFVIALLTMIVSIVAIPVSFFRKTGTIKRWATISLAAFILLIIGAVNTPTTSGQVLNPNENASKISVTEEQSNQAADESTAEKNSSDKEVKNEPVQSNKGSSVNVSKTNVQEEQSTKSSDESTIEKDIPANEVKDQPITSDKNIVSTTSESKKIEPVTEVSGKLKVHFIDVGQADATLLELPNGQVMLIDAGNNGDSDFVVNYLKKTGVKKIDFLVGTHPHEDHIGGLDAVIYNFNIGKVIMPNVNHTSKTYTDVIAAIKGKELTITKAAAGKALLDTNGLTIKLLGPIGNSYDDLNNYSAVIKVTFGKNSFLFQGDTEDVSEQQILVSGANLKADVLKVGHHGSNSSTTQSYLGKVLPKYAVISVGAGNDYGHPTQQTLNRLKSVGAKIYRTDQDGTVIITSDGNELTVSKSSLRHPDSVSSTENSTPAKNITPAPTPSSKNETISAPSTSSQVETPTSSVDNVKITSIGLENEVATIKNFSSKDVDMTGWKLVSVTGNQTFYFPLDYVLKAGSAVKVVSGKGATGDGVNTLKWTTGYIWNNDGDPGALYNSNGQIVSKYTN